MTGRILPKAALLGRMASVDTGGVCPETARDVGEFVGLMRQLRVRSGYTLRQLEGRAAASGDVLPRSTLASVLHRDALPRADVLAAFVRACTGDDVQVQTWAAARDRLAVARLSVAPTPPLVVSASPVAAGDAVAAAPATPGDEPRGAAATPDGRWIGAVARLSPKARRRAVHGVVTLLVLVLAPLAGAALFWEDVASAPSEAAPSAGPERRLAAQESVVQIHPAGAPQLCVTEGRERTGRHDDSVAVQRPCAEVTSPLTILAPVGDGLYHIKWDHPQHGVGCLTLIQGGPAAGMLEPWADCVAGGPAQRFHIEPVAGSVSGWRLRPEGLDACLGVPGTGTATGREIVQSPCTGTEDQTFLIDVLAPA
ncbi:RICIN domain-containing protein [Micromonospora sp. NPDC047730]|uniref:RICIN domain-containing protein n=1 Tax=Micromonospora sp. NPDC047730 TaxID=3364253 RepID=UPI0037119089